MIDRLLWLVLAAGNALPILPTLFPAMLTRLYAIEAGGDVATLMRHRGVLFLVVVIVAIWCAFDPRVRILGVVVLATSVLGFLALYVAGGASPALRQIAIVDAALVPVLAAVAWRSFRPG